MKDFFLEEVERTLTVLQNGGVVLYPTDTIWGLGCDATNAEAVKRIYEIKKREDSKSLIILVANASQLSKYVANPEASVFEFIKKQTRPTTIIFEQAINLPPVLIAADGSIGIRIVRDPFCENLINQLEKPVVSTSANRSGKPSPKNFSEVTNDIKKAVDYIVQWRQNDKTEAQPSQIVRWHNGFPTIIRS